MNVVVAPFGPSVCEVQELQGKLSTLRRHVCSIGEVSQEEGALSPVGLLKTSENWLRREAPPIDMNFVGCSVRKGKPADAMVFEDEFEFNILLSGSAA